MMTRQEIQREIRAHLEAAYPIIPAALTSHSPGGIWKHLEWCYKHQEWNQIHYMLQDAGRTNALPDELLAHLSEVERLFNLSDRLGMRACLDGLTAEEKQVIKECLQAAAHGPFFPDWEFGTLFGFERAEVARAAESWPDVSEDDTEVGAMINGAINNLLGYPHVGESDWVRYISVPPERAGEVYDKFRRLTGRANNAGTGNKEYLLNMGP